MQVREAMSDDVRIANPNQSIRDARAAGVLDILLDSVSMREPEPAT